MIMTAMMEMTALLAKPLNRSAGRHQWLGQAKVRVEAAEQAQQTMMLTAATSTLTISKANRNIVSSRMHNTTAISELGTAIAAAIPAMMKNRAAMRVLGEKRFMLNPGNGNVGTRREHSRRLWQLLKSFFGFYRQLFRFGRKPVCDPCRKEGGSGHAQQF